MTWHHDLAMTDKNLEPSSLLPTFHANLRAVADAMPLIVWTARSDGHLDYYNQRWYDYTGMTFEQTQGWDWKHAMHPDDVQPCIDRWTQAFTTGEPYEIEYRFLRASDGSYRWHLGRALPVRDPGTGQITGWIGTGTDIDDLKRAALGRHPDGAAGSADKKSAS